MRLVKKEGAGPLFKINDKVRTPRGSGVVRYVFLSRARGRHTYFVELERSRAGQVFSQRELKPADGKARGTPATLPRTGVERTE